MTVAQIIYAEVCAFVIQKIRRGPNLILVTFERRNSSSSLIFSTQTYCNDADTSAQRASSLTLSLIERAAERVIIGSVGGRRCGGWLSEHADAKDGVSEYEEDFDDYDEENDWKEDEDAPTAALNASRLPLAGPHSAHPHLHASGHTHASGAEDKPHQRPEDWDDDKSEFAAPSRGQSMRGNAFSETGDPFHQTDESVAHMNHIGTLGSDANTWKVYALCTKQKSKVKNEADQEDGKISPCDRRYLRLLEAELQQQRGGVHIPVSTGVVRAVVVGEQLHEARL